MNRQSTDVKNKLKTSGKGSKNYFRPQSQEELIEILDQYQKGLTVIAGGTDLLVKYYQKLYEIDKWLDLNFLDELKEIKIYDDKVEIGAMVTHERLCKLKKIKELYPVIYKAALDVGSPQIRSRGTIGGNIVTSSPAGDLLPPLLVYDAQLEILSNKGVRTVDINEFFTGPKKNILETDEIIKKIILPLKKQNQKGTWVKVGKRKALVISSISLALNIVLNNENEIEKSRISIGSAAPVPLRITEAEKMLLGKNLYKINSDQIAKVVSEKISPIDDIRGTEKYRRQVAYNITKGALNEVKKQ